MNDPGRRPDIWPRPDAPVDGHRVTLPPTASVRMRRHARPMPAVSEVAIVLDALVTASERRACRARCATPSPARCSRSDAPPFDSVKRIFRAPLARFEQRRGVTPSPRQMAHRAADCRNPRAPSSSVPAMRPPMPADRPLSRPVRCCATSAHRRSPRASSWAVRSSGAGETMHYADALLPTAAAAGQASPPCRTCGRRLPEPCREAPVRDRGAGGASAAISADPHPPAPRREDGASGGARCEPAARRRACARTKDTEPGGGLLARLIS